MRATGLFLLAALAAPSASAAVRDDRKFLLSSDHAASTTMAPRKVPDRLYKPIDSFGSKVELHAEDESKDDGKAKESEKAQDAETAKDGKAKAEDQSDAEQAEKSKESEQAQEAETAKEAQEAEKVEKDNGAEKTSEEGKKTKAEGAEPTTTPSPADTVPPAPAPKYAVGQGIQYDHSEYEDDWHTEWSHGDYPNYKEVHSEGEKLEQYEDRQSDGKASSPGGMYAAEDKKKKD